MGTWTLWVDHGPDPRYINLNTSSHDFRGGWGVGGLNCRYDYTEGSAHCLVIVELRYSRPGKPSCIRCQRTRLMGLLTHVSVFISLLTTLAPNLQQVCMPVVGTSSFFAGSSSLVPNAVIPYHMICSVFLSLSRSLSLSHSLSSSLPSIHLHVYVFVYMYTCNTHMYICIYIWDSKLRLKLVHKAYYIALESGSSGALVTYNPHLTPL